MEGTTEDLQYTERLVRKQRVWWKRLFDVQAPYRWNLRRIEPGFVLEVGCGIGRNLRHLKGNGVGMDHNRHSIEFARAQGLVAFTPAEFEKSEYNRPGRFDSLLLSHVAEHMSFAELVELLRGHAHFVRSQGKLILICPQEVGYASDATHVEFMDFEKLRKAAAESGFRVEQEYSFPFPRSVGRVFIYNEFVSISRKVL